MYDIRQFRTMLYTLVLLGFTGYAVAAETPGLWLVSVGGTLINAWLVRRNAFKPLPRVVANVVTLGFAGWMVFRVQQGGPQIFAIGEFLTFLQLVKLYEQRGNRDIAQLLVLSLLLMIAAAISTASLLFGVVFIIYLVLSLYCCLLFHLKAESDYARTVMGLDASKLNPMTLRQDQRLLPRSMRRLAVVVSTVSVVTALLVFVLFPRNTGAGLIGNLAFKPSQSMTGFNDSVNFQDVARITQNDTQVAWVTIRKNRQPWGATGQTIYLRGSALDTYVSDPQDRDHWRWSRQPGVPTIDVNYNPSDPGSDAYEQDIRLLPTGSRTLFALPGVTGLRSARDLKAKRGADDVLSTEDETAGTAERAYTAISTNADAVRDNTTATRVSFGAYDLQPPRLYPVPDAVREFALRDDVAGTDAAGNPARRRLGMTNPRPDDEAIARSFETYLRTNFKYTLDLTDASVVSDRDPIVQFLYDFKRGHCEYFAGAMALMCQSVGIKARVVVGFKCDEYNTLGSYYVVRQSHAHAWVEALTPRGWVRFDPTSSTEASAAARNLTWWQRVRATLNYLEYKWGSSVVNYDSESQNNVVTQADSALMNTAFSTNSWVQKLKDRVSAWLERTGLLDLEQFYSAVVIIVLTGIAAVVGGVTLFVMGRLRLRRRARRIGLASLSGNEQRRLARQLGFYDQLLKVLERRRIVRGAHLTPREFGASVGFLPAEAYDLVQRLTRVFYRVRYGEAELQPAQQKRLSRSVERIDTLLNA